MMGKTGAGISLILAIVTTACCSSNLALHKPATQSSIYDKSAMTSVVVDGDKGTNYEQQKCIGTRIDDHDPWAQLDLQMTYLVRTVTILNRSDKYPERLHNFTVYLYDRNPTNDSQTPRMKCGNYPGVVARGKLATVTCSPNTVGRFLRVQKVYTQTNDLLHICEIEVYGERPKGVVLHFMLKMGTEISNPQISSFEATTRLECFTFCYKNAICFGVMIKDVVSEGTNCILVSNSYSSNTYTVTAGWKTFLVDLNKPQKRCNF